MVNTRFISVLIGLALLFVVIQHQIVNYSIPQVKMIDNREVECLARNIYFEARNQPTRGQEAVAHVTLNRLKSGKHGNSICEVVYQPYAFSWTLDRFKSKAQLKEIKAEALANEIAFKTMLGETEDPTNGATHYHANYVKPYWSKRLEKKVRIQDHIFYE
jgi:spore germination cell wall hydrolase CwlJ-like protein